MTLVDQLAAGLVQLSGVVKPLRRRGFPPPVVGAWQYPAHYCANTTAAPGSGVQTMMPFDVGPEALSISGIGVGVTTAQVAGTVTAVGGIYADDGSGGSPLLTSAGLLGQGTFPVFTSTGNKLAPLVLTLQPGRYWGAFLYVATVAPTTAPVLNTISQCLSLWATSGTTVGTGIRALTTSGRTALATDSPTLAGNGGGANPVLALKAA